MTTNSRAINPSRIRETGLAESGGGVSRRITGTGAVIGARFFGPRGVPQARQKFSSAVPDVPHLTQLHVFTAVRSLSSG